MGIVFMCVRLTEPEHGGDDCADGDLPTVGCVFNSTDPALTVAIGDFIVNDKRLRRICLSGVAYEFKAREMVANVTGRHLLNKARGGAFAASPVVVVVDEAHNFLGRQIGGEDAMARLDAFELIAKEGRNLV